jgi:two-component system LytT family response regulator
VNSLTAILVDDEESARDVLENLLKRFCPQVSILGKYDNIPDSVDAIKTMQPQLVFLDIEMPNYAGYEIVNFFDNINFEIIFVTAYDKYALRAFEIAAVDYLLKPVDVDRLKEAVERANSSFNIKHNAEKLNLLSATLKEKEIKNILISEKGYQQIIDLSDVIAFEAQESYTYIHTTDKKFTVSKNLKHFETILTENTDFYRVHKSWIISKNHILNYSKSEFLINLSSGIVAKLSKYKKAEFEGALLR